jgi:hypothetical protein
MNVKEAIQACLDGYKVGHKCGGGHYSYCEIANDRFNFTYTAGASVRARFEYMDGYFIIKDSLQSELADTNERLENLRINSAKILKYYVNKCVALNKKLEPASESLEMADQWLRYNDKNPADTSQNADNSEDINEIPTSGNLI